MPRLLAISGSLRAASTNTALLKAASMLAPSGTSIELYRDLSHLPHFNPDMESPLPSIVAELHARIENVDGFLIACPEYARGIPGAFKNALDWLVGSTSFPGMPVALFNASPRASAAQNALRLVLTTMSADVIDDASIAIDLLSKGMDADDIAGDPAMSSLIVKALNSLAAAIAERPVY
ncbi:NAD(P)H-dependent FMN reductase [Luteibacter rhizovicinus]|uniref:NAD(P)H-dependent FMN reductase n=1 Tax=Luteibacter rhizovicinus TaxID=242606 RepID=A0A4R3Z0M6_9GAMM|nr:NADPH-dependent FMN reductase [Luteibacter rhizovicinus]TCV97374.1 NAD(P)H-dependent FMN reductase [Luteibacter rhizovicinus]